MKKAYILKKPLQTKFYTDEKQYEWIVRQAFGQPGRLQSVFEERMFEAGWEKKLDELREKQRAMNVPDERFFHPATLRRLGLNPRLTRSIAQG